MSGIMLVQGNAVRLPLADESVQCVITSPPFYAHRDYGTGTWDGGDPACTHSPAETPQQRGLASSTLGGGKATTGHRREGYKAACPRCGARRVDQQIGLERTPDLYLAALRQVCAEIYRVLRPDGTFWLNMDDTRRNGQLLGLPWRLALALQGNGWLLRSAIAWCKTAPFPESVKNRPTDATEQVFLLTKQARYVYDADAVRVFGGDGWHGSSFESAYDEATRPRLGRQPRTERPGHNLWDYWVLGPEPVGNGHYASFPPALVERCVLAGSRPGDVVCDPFCGSGTTILVARDLHRHSVGLDLSLPYLHLARRRLGCTYDHLPLFQEVAS